MPTFNQAVFATILVVGIGSAGNSQAALYDRGSGLLYDDVLNVTWLQDANYAKTSGYDSDGLMSWDEAQAWAYNLIYHDDVRHVDYSDWRLASNEPVNGTGYNFSEAFNGTTDVGYNITSTNAELAYMYQVNLGLKSKYSSVFMSIFDPSQAFQSDFGIFDNGTFNGTNQNSFGQKNVGLVGNLQAYPYWSGSDYSSIGAWVFNTGIGRQDSSIKPNTYYAWAVRDGDVAASIPEPSILWLFLSGFGLLAINHDQKANRAT